MMAVRKGVMMVLMMEKRRVARKVDQ